nr:hypothetical protein [Tanacetum cinerariifolium]
MLAKMRVPKCNESFSWGKRRGQSMSVKDVCVISFAFSSLQKFNNDGSVLHQFNESHQQKNNDSSSIDGGDRRYSKYEEPLSRTSGGESFEECATREVKEETGLDINNLKTQIRRRKLLNLKGVKDGI